MKKYFLIILSICILTATLRSSAFGQTTSPTSAVTQQQIDELKTKIASKVAELKLVEKRGVLGIVTDTSDTQITLTNFNGDIKNIDVDELTKFYSANKSFGISDVKVGQTLGVLGLYNKDSRRILAREVNDVAPISQIKIGIITNLDQENYEVSISEKNAKKYIFEIEDTTKTFIYTKGTLSKSGFSKLSENQTIIAEGIADKQNKNKFITSRIIALPNIEYSLPQTTPNDSIIPATGSGIKFDKNNK